MSNYQTVDPQTLLSAAKATAIPAAWSGLWFIKKLDIPLDLPANVIRNNEPIPAGVYTFLFKMTESTLHLEPPGTCVMEDSPGELNKHLQFMLQAQGNVLVTGLGLGCVCRGLLANPAVTSVTCIEKSIDVSKLVWPYMPDDSRLEIIQADALEWTKNNIRRFDYAWHDLFTDRDAGEPHLDRWHTQMIFNCLPYIRYQGAWGYSRVAKRFLQRRQVRLIG